MIFSELGYRGDYIQIPPSHRLNSEAELFMMASSYGNPNLNEQIFEECEREYLSSNQDIDVTSPFPKLTCLDGVANRIYTTMLFLNDFIYSTYNKSSYSEAFEFLILQKVNSKIYWAQIGFPYLFLKNESCLLPLDVNYGIRSYQEGISPNIPESLLGLENSLNIKVSSSVIDSKNNEVLFLKTKTINNSFYEGVQSNNEQMIKTLYKGNQSEGAWLGRISFND